MISECRDEAIHEHCQTCFRVSCRNTTRCRIEPCKLACGSSFHMCKESEHELLCMFVKVPCVNAGYGCPVVLKRGEMGKHIEVCPASVVLCTMQWNRWPVYSREKQMRVPFVENKLHARYCQLDVALAMRDQQVLYESMKSSRHTIRSLRNPLTKRFPAVPLTFNHPSSSDRRSRSLETETTASDEDSYSDAPWEVCKHPPGLQQSICEILFSNSTNEENISDHNSTVRDIRTISEEDKDFLSTDIGAGVFDPSSIGVDNGQLNPGDDLSPVEHISNPRRDSVGDRSSARDHQGVHQLPSSNQNLQNNSSMQDNLCNVIECDDLKLQQNAVDSQNSCFGDFKSYVSSKTNNQRKLPSMNVEGGDQTDMSVNSASGNSSDSSTKETTDKCLRDEACAPVEIVSVNNCHLETVTNVVQSDSCTLNDCYLNDLQIASNISLDLNCLPKDHPKVVSQPLFVSNGASIEPAKPNNLSETCNAPLTLQNILALDIDVQLIAQYDTTKPKSMYTFLCSEPFRRDQYPTHFQNVHSEIHGGLNGWIEYRCPLACYGCTFSNRRKNPADGTLIFNSIVKNFGVIPHCWYAHPWECSYPSKKEETPEIYTSKDFDSVVNMCSPSSAARSCCNEFSTAAFDHLTALPFEILRYIARCLDSFSLCNLSMTSLLLRDVCQSLVKNRGVVIQEWEKKRVLGGDTWTIGYQRWLFTTHFTPVTRWRFEENSLNMSDHLKACPFNVKFDGSSDPVKLCGMHVDGLDQASDLTKDTKNTGFARARSLPVTWPD